nr:protein kinase [Ktedonobacteraceae bacterium]
MAYNTTYVGTQIGNYRVTSQLASGGFGSVYLAQHVILSGRIAAFKVLHAVYLSAPHERESFFQEAQLLEKLKHAYILPILDVGLYQNMVPYIIAEYAQHGSLRERIQRGNGRPLPIGEVLTILSQVGEALQHAHQQNIIHRDLKPENILFNTQDIALLADFGIATALTTASVKVGQVAGTPLYMAPEQFRGMASKESDQYGLACIAYELLTGSTPFVAADFMAMAYQHVHEQPRPPRQLNPALPIHMEQAIMKALSKERHDRYPSVTAFIAALQPPSVQQNPPPPPPYPLRQAGGTPVHTPPIKDVRQTPPLQNKGQNNAYSPGIAGQVATKPTAGDRVLAVLCYLTLSMAVFLGITLRYSVISVIPIWIIIALICYFAARKRSFVRFHFMQSQIFVLLTVIIFIGASILHIYNTLSAIFAIYILLTLLYMVLAGAGKRAHIPIIGSIASKYANRQPEGARTKS